jgi:2-dehydro-3-deoxygalactonokinase
MPARATQHVRMAAPGSETSSPRVVALDWGTSSQRAWLLGQDGRVLDVRRPDQGLLSVTRNLDHGDTAALARAYEDVFWRTCGAWLEEHPGLPTLACGMVGSRQGWREAGYLTVPVSLELTAEDLTAVEHRAGLAHLVPGLRVPTAAGGPPGDVIRGEETQVVGILDGLPDPDEPVTLVLPGTHTKWVSVRDRKVTTFTTSTAGELYGLVLEHGILGRTAAPAVPDDAAFRRGAATAASGRGPLVELFGARVLVLEGLLRASSVPDYVSGVLIADEVSHLLPMLDDPGRVVLCGAEDLGRRYAGVLSAVGVDSEVVAEDATVRGLWKIAVSTGLVTRGPTTQEGG